MLTAGVPVFRLPRDLVRHEIAAILSLGVELKCNMALGRDFTIAEPAPRRLQSHLPGHRSAQGPQACHCPAPIAANVFDGMDFLRAFNAGNALPLGRRIVVIGGGNVAYDVARSALRPIDAVATAKAIAEMERGEQWPTTWPAPPCA